MATLATSLAALPSTTAPAVLLTVSFVAVIALPAVCVIGPAPVDVITTGPPLMVPSTRLASESRMLMVPWDAPVELTAEKVPILLPALRSVMSLPPVLVIVRVSATTGCVCVATPPTVTVTVFPLMPSNDRSSSSRSEMVAAADVAVAATPEAARWTSMRPLPAVSVTASPVMSGVASPVVTSRIDWPAERVTVFVDADS